MSVKKTVFISGTSRGIGKSTAELFAQRGWNVIAHARASSPEFERFTTELASQCDVTITPVYFDMRDESAMKEAVKSAIYEPKRTVDALVNNAGICDIGLFMLTSMKNIRDVFDVNLFSHMRLTQLILKRMPKGGAIVNVASVDGLEFKRGESAYGSSKAALLAWTQILRLELLGQVRVNAIAPGTVDTDMAKSIESKAVWKGMTPIMAPMEVSKTIYYLSSDDASAVSGAILKITGELEL